MALTVHRPIAVRDFLDLAGEFLAAREAEHNLILGIAGTIEHAPDTYSEGTPTFGAVTDEDGRVIAATIRTPPFNQVLSEVDDPAAVDLFVESLRHEALPGVLGPTVAARQFALGYAAATGRRAEVAMAERIHRVDRAVDPERPASGAWRRAAAADRPLVAEWLVAFAVEADLPDQPGLTDPLEVADRWISGAGRFLYLWEDAGQVVSLVGAGFETPTGIRIGPVYTPPERRGRGFATSLTAAVTRDQLERGRRFCFLFTDLANPTANHIYRSIGYEPVTDVDMWRFTDG